MESCQGAHGGWTRCKQITKRKTACPFPFDVKRQSKILMRVRVVRTSILKNNVNTGAATAKKRGGGLDPKKRALSNLKRAPHPT